MFGKLKEKINAQRIGSKKISMLKNNTGGNYIGTYEFQDDRIICHVDGNLLKIYADKNRKYELNLNGLCDIGDDSKKICENCNPLKPIYYIIKNVYFDLPVNIVSCGDAHVIFEECVFIYEIKIKCANDIIFENNQYRYINPMYCKEYVLTSVGPINNLKFSNDNFVNRYELHPVKFGMNVKANNIEIINTYIKGDKLSGIELECDNLVVEGSTIICNEINIFSKNIMLDYDKIEANSGFIMDEENMYMDFDQKTKEKEELDDARINLINTLRNLRNKCNQAIENEINEGINKLDKKSTKLKNKKMKKFFK